jgi:ketosteroid isomerase-like protein
VSAAAGGHPSDADRAEAARPVLEELLRAVRAGDADAIGACVDEDVVWLDAARTAQGRPQAVGHLLGVAGPGAEWAAPQQHGAHAILRWTAADGSAGGLVVEVRRGRVVFAAAP